MNYLHIPNNCQARFTFEQFSIPKVLNVGLLDELIGNFSCFAANWRDLCFLFLSRWNECRIAGICVFNVQVIHSALRSYTVLTNNSRILLTVDGQKFPVIVRLLNPEERARTNSGMEVVVAKNIYVGVWTCVECSVSQEWKWWMNRRSMRICKWWSLEWDIETLPENPR